MNILYNLDGFQKNILSKILENFNNYTSSFSSFVSIDETSMFLSFLMYDILNTGMYAEEMYIATYKDSSQINFEIVFNKPQMEEDGLADIEEYIDTYAKVTKLKLIRFLDFIYKLYTHGLIVFSDEEEEQTEYGVWDTHDSKRCKSKGFDVRTIFFSSAILKDFVDKYYSAAIIPTSTLIDFVNNKYLSEEQIQFKRSQLLGKFAIILSFLIGIGSPWLMTKCSKSTIEPAQLESIINAIPERVDEVKLNQEQMDSIITILNKKDKPNYEQTKNAEP